MCGKSYINLSIVSLLYLAKSESSSLSFFVFVSTLVFSIDFGTCADGLKDSCSKSGIKQKRKEESLPGSLHCVALYDLGIASYF